MNVLSVRECTKFLKKHAVEVGPIVVEFDTYRNRDEVSQVRAARDPVDRAKRYCIDTELVTEAEIKEIDKEVKAEVAAAVEAAKAAPPPEQSELWTDVHVGQSKDFFMRGPDISTSSGVYGTNR